MFAFSQIKPETQGRVSDMAVPFTDFIGATAEEALHITPFAEIYRQSELHYAEHNDQPKISAADANRLYPMKGFTHQEPITEEAASLLRDREIDRMDNQYALSNGNHGLLSQAAGMTTGMVVSMVDPIGWAAMFMPFVGPATKLGPMESRFALSALGRGGALRESFNAGIVTSEEIAQLTRFPKFATSVLQGATFMNIVELPKQIGAATEHEDVGNPFYTVAEGTAFAGAMHAGISAAAKAFARASQNAKIAVFTKAMSDFAAGRDIDVGDLLKTDADFVRATMDYDVVGSDGTWPSRFKKEDFLTGEEASAQHEKIFQEKVQAIFDSAIEKLRKDMPEPAPKQTPVVPESGIDWPAELYSHVLDEIRSVRATTTAEVQELFPKAKLTRQEAALLRRQAWGEAEVKTTVEANIQTILDNAEKLAKEKGPGAKAKARRAAEANMPNPFKVDVTEQAHAQVPENTTIEKVKKAADKVKKKIKEGIKAFHGGPAELIGKLKDPFFATTDKKGAKWFATERGGKGGKVHEVRLAIRKPLDTRTMEGSLKLIEIARKAGVEINVRVDKASKTWDHDPIREISEHSPYDGTNELDLLYIPKVRDALKAAGYDGIKTWDTLENRDIPTLIPLDANKQVKLVEAKGKTPEAKAGLVPQKGKLGKQGYFTTAMEGISALSVHISDSAIHLVNIASDIKGTGRAMIEKLQELARETGKPIILTAESLADKANPLAKHVDLELLSENVTDNLDSFAPARDTGVRGYDLADVADKFFEFLTANREMPILDALTAFRKEADASKAQLTKLAKAVKDEIKNLPHNADGQKRLEKYYEDLGFTRDEPSSNEFTFTPEKKQAKQTEAVDPVQETIDEAFKTAKEQRGSAENAMLGAQKRVDNNYYGNYLEHVGDMIHRAAEFLGNGKINYGLSGFFEKVNSLYKAMTPQKGWMTFEEEIANGWKANAEYRVRESSADKARLDKIREELRDVEYRTPKYEALLDERDALLQKYENTEATRAQETKAKADAQDALANYVYEHQQLNPVTYWQKLSNEAAIALGKGNFARLKEIAIKLKDEIEHYKKLTNEDEQLAFMLRKTEKEAVASKVVEEQPQPQQFNIEYKIHDIDEAGKPLIMPYDSSVILTKNSIPGEEPWRLTHFDDTTPTMHKAISAQEAARINKEGLTEAEVRDLFHWQLEGSTSDIKITAEKPTTMDELRLSQAEAIKPKPEVIKAAIECAGKIEI